MRQITINDSEYKKWIKDLCIRYQNSQIKAAIKVNAEQLTFYWLLGKDIAEKDAENRWGDNVIGRLAVDLQREMPGVGGLTQRNIYYCKQFYLLYSQANEFLPQSGAKLEVENFPQVANENKPDIFAVPWGHHKIIIDKCKGDIAKAVFYIHETVANGWSRASLCNWIETNLYERQGKALTNFKQSLPQTDSDLAQQLTKDPYNFAFAGITGDYNERKLKDALLENISRFLMELGTGFAYVGKEYRLQIGETENFIDLLFYNLRLRCYVVIEVKTQKFEAHDIGQVSTYVTAVNHILRDKEKDNPTIGLLICKSKDNTLAQYALEASSQPIGISEYELEKFYPEKVEGTIPTLAEIEASLEEKEDED